MSMKRRSRARWHRRWRKAVEAYRAELAADGCVLTHVGKVGWPGDPTKLGWCQYTMTVPRERSFKIEFFTYPEGAPMSGEKVNFQ